MSEFRITPTLVILLQVFLDDIETPRYGYDLMETTGLNSSKVYPSLAKFKTAGWIEDYMEDIDPATEGRPPRRLYRLTPSGVSAARYEVAAFHQKVAPPSSHGFGKLRPHGTTA